MTSDDKKLILIVDDQPKDAAIIELAVRTSLNVLEIKAQFETKVVGSVQEAAEILNRAAPALLITDLFIPNWEEISERDFSQLSLLQQCDEMEFPHGIGLLRDFAGKSTVKKLATTFFWNYPGFARYSDCLYDRHLADGALPKDIFYLVAGLEDSSRAECAQYPPLRILVQALDVLLFGNSPERISTSIRIRSLFEEASHWLTSFPHSVFEVRNEVKLIEESGCGIAASSSQGKQYEPWDEYKEVVSQVPAALWMPQFVFRSQLAANPASEGIYKRILKQVLEDHWTIDLRIPALCTTTDRQMGPKIEDFEWNGARAQIQYQPYHYHVANETLLSVKNRPASIKEDYRRWAQILITLGFFSYWCHLPDHRSLRSPDEILKIIQDKGGVSYEGKLKNIDEDLEMLELFILKRLRKKHNPFWRFYRLQQDGHIIGETKRDDKKTGYWLNASLTVGRPIVTK